MTAHDATAGRLTVEHLPDDHLPDDHLTAPRRTRPHAAVRPARWAADAVAMMREGARVRLDYSAQSLWRVDRMVEEIRREDAPYDAVREMLRGFGAYAGEVIVRHAGAEWWASGGDHWIRTPDGRLWDPIDEARRCYRGQGSLRLLCRDALGQPEARQKTPK